jgi:hypothetical protein
MYKPFRSFMPGPFSAFRMAACFGVCQNHGWLTFLSWIIPWFLSWQWDGYFRQGQLFTQLWGGSHIE